MEVHQSVGEAVLLRLGVPGSAVLLALPSRQRPARLAVLDDNAPGASLKACLSPPRSDDLLDDIEQRLEALAVDEVLVRARRVERLEMVNVVLVRLGKLLRGRRREDLENGALRDERIVSWPVPGRRHRCHSVQCFASRYPEHFRKALDPRGSGWNEASLRLQHVMSERTSRFFTDLAVRRTRKVVEVFAWVDGRVERRDDGAGDRDAGGSEADLALRVGSVRHHAWLAAARTFLPGIEGSGEAVVVGPGTVLVAVAETVVVATPPDLCSLCKWGPMSSCRSLRDLAARWHPPRGRA